MIRRSIRCLAFALRRVVPGSMADAQSIAYNMFLSFFPVMVFALGLVGASERLSAGVLQLFQDLRFVVPAGSRQLLEEFLQLRAHRAGSLLLLGTFGTLVMCTQVVAGFLQGFRNVRRDPVAPGYWRDQVRAFLLLVVTFVPLFIAVVLTVFGRQLRGWMISRLGLPELFHVIWLVVYVGLALVLAVLTLALLYRYATPEPARWNCVLPGAAVATALWWLLNTGFGIYVRAVPYRVIYGGLAAAIGLMIWMNLIALVVLLGAAYNAEYEALLGRGPCAPR
jgi:membrane protein